MHAQVVSKVLAGVYGCELTKEQWPISLVIGITSKCNIRCYMCKNHSNDTARSIARYQDMPEELFSKIGPLISKVHYIILEGGEPTVSANFLERMLRIRQLNPRVYLGIYTNGVKLSSPEFAEEMVPLFDYVHLSLNGTRSYQEISGGGHSFEDIKRALENIKLVRKRLDKPCKFAIGFVLMKKNLQDIVEAAVLAKEMEADEILYQDLWVYNNTMKSESARHNPELASLMLEEIQKAAQVGIPVRCGLWPQSSGMDTDPNTLKITQESGENFQFGFKDFPLPCYNPWGSVTVIENGKVLLCPNGSTLIGNLRKKSFAEIWFGDEARRYRKGIINGYYYKDCSRCKLIFKDKPKAYEKGRKFLHRMRAVLIRSSSFLRKVMVYISKIAASR